MAKILVRFEFLDMNTEKYDASVKVMEAAGLLPAKSLEYHASAAKGDGLVMVDVWSSVEEFEEFGAKLKPLMEKAGIRPVEPEILPIHKEIR